MPGVAPPRTTATSSNAGAPAAKKKAARADGQLFNGEASVRRVGAVRSPAPMFLRFHDRINIREAHPPARDHHSPICPPTHAHGPPAGAARRPSSLLNKSVKEGTPKGGTCIHTAFLLKFNQYLRRIKRISRDSVSIFFQVGSGYSFIGVGSGRAFSRRSGTGFFFRGSDPVSLNPIRKHVGNIIQNQNGAEYH